MTNQIIKRLHRPFTLFIICILIIAFFILTNINKKTAPSGNEQYNHSFVFGGTENDYGFGISVINDDYLIIAGHTSSTNFNQINNLKRIGTIGKSNIFIALISQKKQAITKMIIIGGEDND
ncbi:MAG: hypothetical protein OEM02_06565, partial [Desulfobulbaceae bacterium]|nr:hypothetical protein [Desulfobulbaceae bacterium]